MQGAVKKQHILPRKSIERFYDGNRGDVNVLRLKEGKSFFAKADNKCFVAQRKWDEQIEREASKIEMAFQKLVTNICNGLTSFDKSQLLIIEQFYCLLSQRSFAKDHVSDEKNALTDIHPTGYSIETIEKLERDGIFFGDDSQLDRAVRGLAQRLALSQANRVELRWGLIHSAIDTEFLVSDCYHGIKLIPVSPSVYLQRDRDSANLTEDQVAFLNTKIMSSASSFVFCRSFDRIEFLNDESYTLT